MSTTIRPGPNAGRPGPGTGADLARRLHEELVAPLIGRTFPGLRYAAGRLGSGSDVLGLDDAMSRDHDWGCRLTVLLDEADAEVVPALDRILDRELPDTFHGHPVRFATTWDPAVSHRVHITTVPDFARGRLGVNPLAGLSVPDWLTLTGQGVLEVIGGPVFVDGTTGLTRVRDMLSWYPPDLERYVLASGWQRMAQRMPLIGRTAQRNQHVQSRLICARLAGDAMRLALLLYRRWPPYDKWIELTLSELPLAGKLSGLLATAVGDDDWTARQDALAAAADVLLGSQRDRGLPTPASGVTKFWDRPYRTIDEAVPSALLADIADPAVARLPTGVGSIEQWVDSVDVLARPNRRAAITAAYREWMTTG